MNSLPPQARVVPDFLDRDEAESLTEALLSLVEETPTITDEDDPPRVEHDVGRGRLAESADGRDNWADVLPDGQDSWVDVLADAQGDGSDGRSADVESDDIESDDGVTNLYEPGPNEPVDLLDDLFAGPEGDTEGLDDQVSSSEVQESNASANDSKDRDRGDDNRGEVNNERQDAPAPAQGESSETGDTQTEELAREGAELSGAEANGQAPIDDIPGTLGRPVSDSGLVYFDRPTLRCTKPASDATFLAEEGKTSGSESELGSKEHPGSETVAGSGPSEDASSETIAESGYRSLSSGERDDRRPIRGVRVFAGVPRKAVEPARRTDVGSSEPEQRTSFSWVCSERVASNSRDGFGLGEPDPAPRARTSVAVSKHEFGSVDLLDDVNRGPESRLTAPFLASSDIAGIQTFRTRGAGIRNLRRLAGPGRDDTSQRTADNDGADHNAGPFLNRSIARIREDTSSIILAGMMGIGLAIFTWLLYLYLVKDPSLPSDVGSGAEGALLLGPTVVRFRRRLSFWNRPKLAAVDTDVASVLGAAAGVVKRGEHSDQDSSDDDHQERFVVHSVGTRDFAPRVGASVAIYVVDLPRLRCHQRPHLSVSDQPSDVARCRRDNRRGGRRSIRRQSVVNRRSRAR